MSPVRRCAMGDREPSHRLRPLLLVALCAVLVQSACRLERRPARHVVEITHFLFEPDTLRVAVGDTIVWVNRDAVPHTATARDDGWDSGSIAAQARWTHVIDRAGEAPYVCAIHPSMVGWIEVH